MRSDPSVSVILPATDETYSLEETVDRIVSLMPQRDLQFLVVTHPTLTTPECRSSIVRLTERFGARIEAFDQKRPRLGGALQDAFEKARGTYTVLMASDLETDPAVVPELIRALEGGADVAATTRWKSGARFSGYDPAKFVLNFLFQHFFRILYWTDLTDLTYAFRAYRTDILRTTRWEELQFPFLFESVLKPLRLGYRIVEIEAPWRARTEGVSHNSLAQTLDYTRVGLRLRFLPKSKMVY